MLALIHFKNLITETRNHVDILFILVDILFVKRIFVHRIPIISSDLSSLGQTFG